MLPNASGVRSVLGTFAGGSHFHDAGIELGRTYPRPIVDHGEARLRALAAYKSIAGATAGE